MRMWNVDPKYMCTKHLLGEHVEMHMFVGHIKAGKALGRYASEGLVDSSLIQARHDELMVEMKRRGMNHKSPMRYRDQLSEGEVSVDASLAELRRRCNRCSF